MTKRLARCGTLFLMSAVVGAAVPAAVCRWGLCSCCPGVGRCLSGVNNHQRVALARCGCGYVYAYIHRYAYAYIQQRGDSRTAKLWARACSSTPLACEQVYYKRVACRYRYVYAYIHRYVYAYVHIRAETRGEPELWARACSSKPDGDETQTCRYTYLDRYGCRYG